MKTGNGVGEGLFDLFQTVLPGLQSASQILEPGVDLHAFGDALFLGFGQLFGVEDRFVVVNDISTVLHRVLHTGFFEHLSQ